MVTTYNVVSSDGFITERDGSEDFIPDEVWNDFIDLCKRNDAVVMGRKTYDTLQKYDQKMLNEFEVTQAEKIVVSKDENFSPKGKYVKTGSPQEAVLSKPNVLVSSGPSLNSFLLAEGLIDRVILNILDVKLGDGIKPFDMDNFPDQSSLVSEEAKPPGRKMCTYKVHNAYLVG